MKISVNLLTSMFFVMGMMLTAVSSAAGNTSFSGAVNRSSCDKVAGTTQPFILVLNSGDELLDSLTQCAKDAKLKSASVSGLGQLQDPILAYFTKNLADKPIKTAFSGYYELVSLNGNITNNGGQYYTHVHASLADKNLRAILGHVSGAKVGLTAEITVVPLQTVVQRTVDPETGFGLIVH